MRCRVWEWCSRASAKAEWAPGGGVVHRTGPRPRRLRGRAGGPQGGRPAAAQRTEPPAAEEVHAEEPRRGARPSMRSTHSSSSRRSTTSAPRPLVNALDHLYSEWSYKAGGFVSYGGVSGGLRCDADDQADAHVLQDRADRRAVPIPFVAKLIEDGRFAANEMHDKSAVTIARRTAAMDERTGATSREPCTVVSRAMELGLYTFVERSPHRSGASSACAT